MKQGERHWTPAEDAVLLETLGLEQARQGWGPVVAARLGRTISATYNRIAKLRAKARRVKTQDGAEGGLTQKVRRARVPRGAPSAAAPISELVYVSSQNLADAVSPAAAGAVPVAAPAGFPGAKREARLRRERQALKALMAELKPPPPDSIERRCCACREVFVATSRFLFRCEPCRRGTDLPAQYQSASRGGRVGVGRHG